MEANYSRMNMNFTYCFEKILFSLVIPCDCKILVRQGFILLRDNNFIQANKNSSLRKAIPYKIIPWK